MKLWNFLVPPVVRLSIALLILFFFFFGPMAFFGDMNVYFRKMVEANSAGPVDVKLVEAVAESSGGASSSFGGGKHSSGDAVASAPRVVTVLQNLSLGGLVPIVLLGVIIATAYATNQLMVGISALIPLKVNIDQCHAVAKAAVEFDEYWMKTPDFRKDWKEQLNEIEARELIGNDASTTLAKKRKAQQDAMETHVQFIKFLILWTAGCAGVTTVYGSTGCQFIWVSAILGILFLVMVLIITFGQLASNQMSLLVARIKAANASINSTPGSINRQGDDRSVFIQKAMLEVKDRALHSHCWWGVSWALPDLLLPLKSYGFKDAWK